MPDRRRIIVLQGAPESQRSPAAHEAWTQARRCEARTDGVATVAAADAAIAQGAAAGQVLVLLVDPDTEQGFAAARQLARRHPELRFVFAVAPGQVQSARRTALFGAPAGGRWSLAVVEGEAVAQQLRQALALSEQQGRLRTTLDRMRLRLSSATPADASEYRRLIASDRYLASVLQNASDAIASVDAAGRVMSWNAGAERLFGATRARMAGLAMRDVFDAPEVFDGAIEQARQHGTGRAELVTSRAGTPRVVEATFDWIGDGRGEVLGIAVIVRDVTERHQVEEELRSLSNQKDEFLAVLGHELRNPLAPIRNAAYLLRSLELADPRARNAVEMINRQASHMAGLIDDLLDVSRVTRGIITLDVEPLRLGTVVSDAVEQVRGLVERKHHHLRVTDAAHGVRVRGDRKRLTQIFANLLNNSAKFTPEGGVIAVDIGVAAEEVVVTVRDNGVGMSPAILPRVFDLFLRAEPELSASSGGLGIGLALVRKLTLLHGGTVTAESEGPGAGSTFTVRLPLLKASEPAEVREWVPPSAAPKRLTLLIVDDNEDAAHSLASLLEAHGHSVHVQTDPRHAQAQAERLQPDVMIIDIGMPHLTGHELARRLREATPTRRLVLVALTGYGLPADRDRTLAAGFDHHLVKPIDPSAVIEVLSRV